MSSLKLKPLSRASFFSASCSSCGSRSVICLFISSPPLTADGTYEHPRQSAVFSTNQFFIFLKFNGKKNKLEFQTI
nr:MAG TPA: hypothetical protein [Caudoviricetes sp.]